VVGVYELPLVEGDEVLVEGASAFACGVVVLLAPWPPDPELEGESLPVVGVPLPVVVVPLPLPCEELPPPSCGLAPPPPCVSVGVVCVPPLVGFVCDGAVWLFPGSLGGCPPVTPSCLVWCGAGACEPPPSGSRMVLGVWMGSWTIGALDAGR
jgi:hypothetical protein